MVNRLVSVTETYDLPAEVFDQLRAGLPPIYKAMKDSEYANLSLAAQTNGTLYATVAG